MRTIFCITIACACACAAATEQVNTIDARQLDAQGAVVTAERVEFTADGKKESLPRADVAEIIMGKAADPMTRPGQCVLTTLDGACLAVANLTLSGTRVKFDSVLLGATEMSLDSVKAIFQPDSKATAQQVSQRCQDLKVAGSQQDILVVAKSDADWVTIDGVVRGIDADNVTFNWEEGDRLVGRKTVKALWAALLGKKDPRPPAGTIVGADGSAAAFVSLTMDDKSLAVDLPGIGKKTLARTDVAAIRFNSDRVVNLADLKPADVKEHGLLDNKYPHRVNRSVSGKEIRLDGQAYSTGLGLHSFTELTYPLGGAYSTFVTVAGIDDSVRPAGNATITFLGDGKELDKPLAVTGKDKAVTVRLKIAGVKQLTIRVDFGSDNLDVSDHVDLASARLIK